MVAGCSSHLEKSQYLRNVWINSLWINFNKILFGMVMCLDFPDLISK